MNSRKRLIARWKAEDARREVEAQIAEIARVRREAGIEPEIARRYIKMASSMVGESQIPIKCHVLRDAIQYLREYMECEQDFSRKYNDLTSADLMNGFYDGADEWKRKLKIAVNAKDAIDGCGKMPETL